MTDKDQIQQLQSDIHKWARGKGFYDDPRTVGDSIALMHSELSEALEAFRKTGGIEPHWSAGGDWWSRGDLSDYTDEDLENVQFSPEGVGPEFADCVIRILDSCEFYGIDLSAEIALKMAYNENRPYRHGKKAL